MTPSESWDRMLDEGGTYWFKAQAHDTRSMRAGDRILMPSARMIDAYIRAIPPGEGQDVSTMRRNLAATHDAATTCPVTTGLQLRRIAEAVHDSLEQGAPLDDVTPVWRVIDHKATVLKKLSLDPALILEQRDHERRKPT